MIIPLFVYNYNNINPSANYLKNHSCKHCHNISLEKILQSDYLSNVRSKRLYVNTLIIFKLITLSINTPYIYIR